MSEKSDINDHAESSDVGLEKPDPTRKKSLKKSLPSKKKREFIDFSGKVFDEFHLIRLIGHGAMSEVYLAEQTTLHRKVAIKILRSELLAETAHLDRFKQEARASASLTHPNIVQVYSTGESDGYYYIAQEYINGINLKEHIEKNGPVSVPMAIHIIKQVALALQAAGNAKIVHRDIKPDNIMISSNGDVKVADFGLALLTEPGKRVNVTQVGVTVGTPRYMSPEQLHGKKLDQRSDIYSFGVTAYQMLAGKPPFRGGTALTVAVQHINEEAEPLASHRPDLLPAVCELVHKMIRKKPTERYSNGKEIIDDLKKIIRALKEGDDAAVELTLTEFPVVEDLTTDVRKPFSQQLMSIILLKQGFKKYLALLVLLLVVSFGISWTFRTNPFRVPARIENNEDPISELYAEAISERNDENLWLKTLKQCDKPENSNYKPKVYEHLTRMYIDSGRFSEAKDACEKWIDLEQNKARGNLLLALIAHLENKPDQSKLILEREVIPYQKSLDRFYRNLLNQLTKKK